MRRAIGYGAFLLGAFLLFLAPLLRWYVVPRVEKAHNDVYDRSTAEGHGQYFILTEGRLSEPTDLVNLTISKADPERSTDDVVVIDQFSRTYDPANDRDVGFSLETYVMDRHTGEAVHCCGETPRKEGHTLKLPFHVEKRSYPFYDSTAEQAFPAEFVDEEEVAGLHTFRFVSDVPETLLGSQEVPGFLVGRPDEPIVAVDRYHRATTTIWVEPTTGGIIKGSQTARQWFLDGETGTETVLADVTFTSDAASIEATADRIRSDLWKLQLVRVWIPLVAPIVGLALLVLGVFLLSRSEPSSPSPRTDAALSSA